MRQVLLNVPPSLRENRQIGFEQGDLLSLGRVREIIGVLQDVRKGRFGQRVQVIFNDEIGFAGDVINEMNSGLQERDLIKDTFGKYVAKEVRDEVLSGRVPLDGEKRDVTVLFQISGILPP